MSHKQQYIIFGMIGEHQNETNKAKKTNKQTYKDGDDYNGLQMEKFETFDPLSFRVPRTAT